MASNNISISSKSPQQTRLAGKIVGQLSHKGLLILLNGEMGSGKTTLVQGLLNGLGSKEIARSPTFIIISKYSAAINLFHVDLYRVTSEDSIYDIGLDDCISEDSICVIEWPGRYPDLYDLPHIKIQIDKTENEKRLLQFSTNQKKIQSLLEKISSEAKEQI